MTIMLLYLQSEFIFHKGDDEDKRMIQLLLKRRADVKAQGGYYGNALQAACYKGYMSTVKLLLKEGANVNVQGGYYHNALRAARENGNQAVTQLLLNAGAEDLSLIRDTSSKDLSLSGDTSSE